MKKKINLEWYVLNSTHERKFESYPYHFHETDVRPWNVFDNWPFRDAAIKLAKLYKKGKLRDYAMKTAWGGDERQAYEKMNDYEIFKDLLMHELRYAESGRCEYEITVGHWPPDYVDKNGERICVYCGQDHEPIDDVRMDKIDCYMQVLPNVDIFAKYVLETVNGTL